MTSKLWIAGMIVAAACGKKDGGSDKAKAGPPAAIDVAAVNALVPAALKDKIVFEQRDVVLDRGHDKTTYTLAAPKGWTQDSKMFGNLKADDKGGFFTKLSVGPDCGGDCKPKTWEQVSDEYMFKPKTTGKVIKDEKSKGRRTMIAEVDSNGAKLTDVVVAWWTDGDSNYHFCSAELDEAVKDAAPAFEKACQVVNIAGKD